MPICHNQGHPLRLCSYYQRRAKKVGNSETSAYDLANLSLLGWERKSAEAAYFLPFQPFCLPLISNCQLHMGWMPFPEKAELGMAKVDSCLKTNTHLHKQPALSEVSLRERCAVLEGSYIPAREAKLKWIQKEAKVRCRQGKREELT